jgi:hypothetical protein
MTPTFVPFPPKSTSVKSLSVMAFPLAADVSRFECISVRLFKNSQIVATAEGPAEA